MRKIKALIMDVDGTLTDGRINIGQNGELFKSFYCRDGLAILSLKEKDIIPVILTSRSSDIVINRAKEIGIDYVIQGTGSKKLEALKNFLFQNNYREEEIAYIGDDINDLECMKISGIVGCPGDSVKEVKEIADYICKCNGGNGAVREFIEYITT